MPSDDPGMPWPGRRAVLTGGLGALAALTLSGCGIRLEDDAPRVPLIPTRSPVPGESFLVGLRHRCVALATEAKALGGAPTGLPARLTVLHSRQATILEAELERLTVPRSVIEAPPKPTGSSTSTTTSTTTATTSGPSGTSATAPAPAETHRGPGGLAASELADVGATAVAALARIDADARPLIGALLAQRLAAATLLGAARAVPVPTWKAPSLASAFLDTTRAAIYAMQVVAAQSPTGAQRILARTTLATLVARAQIQEQLAAESAGPPPLGYPPPFVVTTPTAARRLAVQVLADLRAANARDVGSAGSDPEPLGSAVQWLADTEVLASRWGVALSPFPGLK
ncbi:DUF4439 domain-containing protein [Nostocoides sp. HKS02]|uniref:DUF4439 domain-containing protein n=1 Tax=Nostocoides sp. HKS02 TaxID=1813880 RepID=UPI0012B46D0A|nr:DUF4439 domain-containing protein [Tetrasphaera sp. HKS02]QGN57768.1 DUF4439 domain-containing protein [Tetrasphaera sp. HKS02]